MTLSGQGLARLHDVLDEHADSKAGISPTRIDRCKRGWWLSWTNGPWLGRLSGW